MTTGEGAVGPGWQRLGAAGLQARALRIQRADVAFFKHIFESYEEVGMVRTVETRPDATVLIAVLAVDDYVHVAQAVIDEITERGAPWLEPAEMPQACHEDWFLETWTRPGAD